ncbi:MAG: hypothetical protein M1816_004942 [Peltula sp. TS41687]|nr:MAG: hypothetical protein M1816_004942 [Peltula sp. TS41687]
MGDDVLALKDTLSKQEADRLRKEEDSLREEIERWLSPLEFLARQRDLSGKRFETGQWLLKSEEFTSWAEGRPWQLRCYGDTGSGKHAEATDAAEALKANTSTAQALYDETRNIKAKANLEELRDIFDAELEESYDGIYLVIDTQVTKHGRARASETLF